MSDVFWNTLERICKEDGGVCPQPEVLIQLARGHNSRFMNIRQLVSHLRQCRACAGRWKVVQENEHPGLGELYAWRHWILPAGQQSFDPTDDLSELAFIRQRVQLHLEQCQVCQLLESSIPSQQDQDISEDSENSFEFIQTLRANSSELVPIHRDGDFDSRELLEAPLLKKLGSPLMRNSKIVTVPVRVLLAQVDGGGTLTIRVRLELDDPNFSPRTEVLSCCIHLAAIFQGKVVRFQAQMSQEHEFLFSVKTDNPGDTLALPNNSLAIWLVKTEE